MYASTEPCVRRIGLKLKETRACGGAVIITGFARGPPSPSEPGGQVLQAEASGKLFVGMLMLAVGGELVFGRPFDDVSTLGIICIFSNATAHI
jgi:hypothetical protein